MKHVNCPECGHKLIEGEEGSIVQIKCSKCQHLLSASIGADEVVIKIKGKQTRKNAAYINPDAVPGKHD